jgi:AcrR family transcriptional regulator
VSVGGSLDRRPGRPRDARADVAIVEATLAEISERGFGGATIEGIAARAGVGKATIYRRWRSKEELLRFVAGQVSDVCAVPDTGNVRDDLRAIFEPMGAVLCSSAVGSLVPELIAEAARNPDMRSLMRSFAEERRDPALEVIRGAIERRELPSSVDTDTVVDLICGAIVYRCVVLGDPVSHQDIDRMIDQALGSRE